MMILSSFFCPSSVMFSSTSLLFSLTACTAWLAKYWLVASSLLVLPSSEPELRKDDEDGVETEPKLRALIRTGKIFLTLDSGMSCLWTESVILLTGVTTPLETWDHLDGPLFGVLVPTELSLGGVWTDGDRCDIIQRCLN